MKVKLGELTVKQLTEICKGNDHEKCPFRCDDLACDAISSLICTDLEKEIELPDEEEKK